MALGMTINMMVMFGLVLAVGVLVDDPIVVVEYAQRKLQEGVSKRDAFIMSAKKMFVPVRFGDRDHSRRLRAPAVLARHHRQDHELLPTVVIIVMIASLVSALIFMP